MKRPCIALSFLLASLAACLVVSPSKACSLGELAVAMQVAHHDCDTGLVACPLACPRLDDSGELESTTPALNAAASDAEAVDPACDECYGVYEDYCHDYADQYEDAEEVQGPVVEAAPDLNQAGSDTTAVDGYEDYGVVYANEYESQPEAEMTPEEPVYVDEEFPCDDTICEEPCSEDESDDEDETSDDEEGACEEEMTCDEGVCGEDYETACDEGDCYEEEETTCDEGDCYEEETTCDEGVCGEEEETTCDEGVCGEEQDETACDESYGEEEFYSEQYNLYSPVLEDNGSQASDEDLIVNESEEEGVESCPAVEETETADTLPELVNPYDYYGRQVGDDGCEDEACPEAEAPSDCEYSDYCEGYQSDASDDDVTDEGEDGDDEDSDEETDEEGDDATDEMTTDETADETTVQACPGSTDDCYGDCYGDCYHYAYGCEEEAAEATEDAVEESSEVSDEAAANYGSGYDATYDEAVYGPQECTPCDDAPPAYDEAMLNDESEYDVPPLPETSTQPLVENDLPWEDEVQEAAQPAETAEVQSEYGSDYAEDYYGSFAHEVEVPEESASQPSEEAVEESSEAEYEEAYEDLIPPLYEDETHYDCDATEVESCEAPRGLDVSRLAVACGDAISGLTEMLSSMTQTIRTAHADLMRFGR